MKKSCLTAIITVFLLLGSFGIHAQTASNQKELAVAFEVDGMKDVIIKKDIPFLKTADSALKLDIYYPPKFDFKSKIPTVVFIFGYTNSGQLKTAKHQLRTWSPYTSWCRVVAASGMAAIVYETNNPESDLNSLMGYINTNADKLSIDAGKIGAYSCSANTPVALANILNSTNNYFKCAAIYYGIFLNSDFKYLSDARRRPAGAGSCRCRRSTRTSPAAGRGDGWSCLVRDHRSWPECTPGKIGRKHRMDSQAGRSRRLFSCCVRLRMKPGLRKMRLP